MYSQEQTKAISVAGLMLIYLLSVGLLFFNPHFQILNRAYDTFSLLTINKFWALFINLIFLGSNSFFISKIFTKRGRDVAEGNILAFVYLLIHNKIWFLNTLNHYLVRDFFILFFLFFIYPREVKQRLLVFYLSILFSTGFLIGIHMVYTFIIPVIIIEIFLISDWKIWIVFLLGFSLPIYLYITVFWLFDKDPFLYLNVLIKHSMYPIKVLADIKDSGVNGWRWTDVSVVFTLSLLLVSGIREWIYVHTYPVRDRQLALFFFLLMALSLVHYGLVYYWYKPYALPVMALPFSYYVGKLINKISLSFRYLVLFLLIILTSFL